MTNYYLGVMSGTSLDGVDIALIKFPENPPHFSSPLWYSSEQIDLNQMFTQPRFIAGEVYEMPNSLRQSLAKLLQSGQIHLQQLGELDHQLALLYADCINRFLSKYQLHAEQIQAVGCHGQTVWHSPQGDYPFTMQLGDGNLIAAKTGITTVTDFRRKDMAFGGQGAPLVPAFHQAMFSHPDWATVVLNIGGISNISQLVPNQPVIGYDTGVGNALMDLWIEKHLGQHYDKDGNWAASGKVQTALLQAFLAEPYLHQPAPKSTGRELFNLAWLDKKLQDCTDIAGCTPQDIQATLLEFTVQCNVRPLLQLSQQIALPCRLLVCGGGAKNSQLMQRLRQQLPQWQVVTTSEQGLHIDYVEAAAFAWLAHQRLHQLPGNLPLVTGAKSAVSLGAVYSRELL